MQRGNTFGRICLFVCLSVCLFVCNDFYLLKTWTYKAHLWYERSSGQSQEATMRSQVICLSVKGNLLLAKYLYFLNKIHGNNHYKYALN